MPKSAVLIAAVVVLAAAGVGTYLAWPSSSRTGFPARAVNLPVCSPPAGLSMLAGKAYCEEKIHEFLFRQAR